MQHSKAWTAGGLLLVSATLASMMTANADSFQQVDARKAGSLTAGGAPPVLLDFLQKDPIVIYNLSGVTLLGQVHQQLTLYDDGSAVCSEIDPLAKRAGSVQVKALEAGAMRWFLDELILWGAHLLEDGTTVALDAPMATMTMLFKDASGSVDAHTFSYYPVAEEGNAAEVDRVVQAFIAEYFAAGSGSDWSGIDPPQRRSGAQGIDPSQRSKQAADEIDATQRSKRTADEVDALQRSQRAVDEVDATQRGKQAADEIEPTLRGKQAADEIDPTQRGKLAAYQFVPKKRALDAQGIEPSQRARKAQAIDASQRGRRVKHVDPVER